MKGGALGFQLLHGLNRLDCSSRSRKQRIERGPLAAACKPPCSAIRRRAGQPSLVIAYCRISRLSIFLMRPPAFLPAETSSVMIRIWLSDIFPLKLRRLLFDPGGRGNSRHAQVFVRARAGVKLNKEGNIATTPERWRFSPDDFSLGQ